VARPANVKPFGAIEGLGIETFQPLRKCADRTRRETRAPPQAELGQVGAGRSGLGQIQPFAFVDPSDTAQAAYRSASRAFDNTAYQPK
jgi:hypothetical protein